MRDADEIGAIPPLAEMQAQLWVYRLLQAKYPRLMPPHPTDDWTPHANSLPPYELDWALHCRDGEHDFSFTKGGVDHEAYAYQLALDLGAAPTFRHVLGKGFKVFYTWAMGSNFNTKFRLVGPWKEEEEAESIMRTELYDVVKKTGGLVCEYPLLFCLLSVTWEVGQWERGKLTVVSQSSPPTPSSRWPYLAP